MLKLLFWAVVAFDVVVLGIFGLLGLAAAKPSQTNPIAALVIPFLLPGLVLAVAIAVFLRSSSTGWRVAALVVAASPLLALGASRILAVFMVQNYSTGPDSFSQFRAGPLRDIETAIGQNDAEAVARAARGADLNRPGVSGTTLLILAVDQLQKTPDRLEVLRALLAAGADPNVGKDELPLQGAIGVSRSAGPEPVRLLLDAGADPNARRWDEPVYFIAGGAGIDPGIMTTLLDRGADIQARGRDGHTVLSLPTSVGNWPVVALLLRRGAPWRDTRSLDGLPFRAYLESRRNAGVDTVGLAEVIRILDPVPPVAEPPASR